MIGAVLLASLAGSLHCGAMCGGFVLLYTGAHGAHFAYHLGRLLAYATLGAAIGFIAGQVDVVGEALLGVRRTAGVALGGALVVAAALAWFRPNALAGSSRSCRTGGIIRRFAGRSGVGPALAVGALAGLLPCGWLWGFVALAGASGSALGGVLVMAAFWAGTVPVLAVVGGLATWIRGRFPGGAHRLAAAGLLCAGLLAVFGSWSPMLVQAEEAPPVVCHPQ